MMVPLHTRLLKKMCNLSRQHHGWLLGSRRRECVEGWSETSCGHSKGDPRTPCRARKIPWETHGEPRPSE